MIGFFIFLAVITAVAMAIIANIKRTQPENKLSNPFLFGGLMVILLFLEVFFLTLTGLFLFIKFLPLIVVVVFILILILFLRKR